MKLGARVPAETLGRCAPIGPDERNQDNGPNEAANEPVGWAALAIQLAGPILGHQLENRGRTSASSRLQMSSRKFRLPRRLASSCCSLPELMTQLAIVFSGGARARQHSCATKRQQRRTIWPLGLGARFGPVSCASSVMNEIIDSTRSRAVGGHQRRDMGDRPASESPPPKQWPDAQANRMNGMLAPVVRVCRPVQRGDI